jgi:Kdo2-lipid IVA lauroyltransferase/acyltransferase
VNDERAPRRIALRSRLAWALACRSARLPMGWRWALAERLGRNSLESNAVTAEVMRANLALCFPQWSALQCQEMLRINARETFFAAIDQFRSWALTREQLIEQVAVDNIGLLRDLRGQGPVVFLCPHFLGMEFACQRLGLEISCMLLYGPSPRPDFDALRQRARARFGTAQMVTMGSPMISVLRRLRAGTPLLLLPDLDLGPRGSVFCSFFGQQACTNRTAAWAAARTGAAVVPLSVRRTEGGGRYVLTFHTPVTNLDSDIDAGTQRINATIEALVRNNPQQYWWAQPRFATRPPGEMSLYSPRVMAYAQERFTGRFGDAMPVSS